MSAAVEQQRSTARKGMHGVGTDWRLTHCSKRDRVRLVQELCRWIKVLRESQAED